MGFSCSIVPSFRGGPIPFFVASLCRAAILRAWGPIPTDMQRLTAVGVGTKTRDQRTKTRKQRTENKESETANRKPPIEKITTFAPAMDRSRTYSPTISRRTMFPAPPAQAYVPVSRTQRYGNSNTDYCSLFTIRWTFTFSAKEKDTETGFSYFGSRYYNSDLSIWLSVDPQVSKYPSLSPYVYCANNPIKLVDPNGEEWDIDGYKYYPGQECPDDAQQSTRDKWNAMNTIYSTKEGKDVIDHMNKKGVWYCVSSESCPSKIAGGQYVPDGNKTGGTIFLNGGSDIGTLAHEMFHGYQDQKNQGDVSQHNELQARLFSDDITSQVQLKVATGLPQLQITEQGISADLFNYNVGKVRSGSYTDNNMGQLEELFSSFERFKAYRNNPVKIDGQTDLYGELKNK